MVSSMLDWKLMALGPEQPILDALRRFEDNHEQICLVVDPDDRLLGTITEGDVRRALLGNLTLQSPVQAIMTKHPIQVRSGTSAPAMLRLMRHHVIRYIPVVDEHGRVQALQGLQDLIMPTRDNSVVLMAGGEGRRLRPLTETCPKPMVRIGTKPILELILQEFIDQGFHKFYISINYLGDKIKQYFGDGSFWNVEINYLKENDKMGTAGALSLLPERPRQPIIVMNGDLLTRVNFQELLDHHEVAGNAITLGIRDYAVEIPYGVVILDNQRVTGLMEKPTHRYSINCGVYALDPRCLELVPRHMSTDMPKLMQDAIDAGWSVGGFPIDEYWIDIGRMSDLERANREYMQLFPQPGHTSQTLSADTP
ncbi:conserved protein of unknown function, putative nucleotidyl transferase (plasmid) [Azospirillum lipoferum 4B]|uniref:CBS domain-containing protein n=2 Tax=Azospirillum lipoferum TaxID=193 RepID=G7ZJ16_AZOL4|nr:conserved protein of unknown function, putative nucleotidyl transferase [Azospirillum lipoferum 4B]